MEQMLFQHLALFLQPLHGHRVQQIEDDREQGASRVHAQRHPPQKLFVQLLLKVLQNEQADRESRQGAR